MCEVCEKRDIEVHVTFEHDSGSHSYRVGMCALCYALVQADMLLRGVNLPNIGG